MKYNWARTYLVASYISKLINRNVSVQMGSKNDTFSVSRWWQSPHLFIPQRFSVCICSVSISFGTIIHLVCLSWHKFLKVSKWKLRSIYNSWIPTYLKYLNLLLTKPIVQHPLLIALVAPAILFSTPHKSVKLCPLLPMDDNATDDPLLDGIIATAR